ncbi:MAG: ADP-ribose pyrophosphatase YjhB (NUDIX family) [Granulosicoccus sp.]|jgi:ADP-ribose pyrophosphatase YjhB (NUDIX family)
MRLLKTVFHPDVSPGDINPESELTLVVRHAARGIVIEGENILLLYTERYHDYSLPGGGIDEGEDFVEGLKRELREETGAKNVRNVKPFARYDEYRPWYKPTADIIHMISHCYVCDIDRELGKTALEPYELNNGMKPLWVNIYEAIAHNDIVIANSDKKGLSVERETFLLKVIAEEWVAGQPGTSASERSASVGLGSAELFK